MMTSLRSATRNTGFERWLGATLMPPPGVASPGQADAGAGACCCADEQATAGVPEPSGAPAAGASQQHRALDDVAEYLGGGGGGAGGGGGGEVAGAAAGSPAGGTPGVFRPGWEDIFRMNQTQLEVRWLPGRAGRSELRAACLRLPQPCCVAFRSLWLDILPCAICDSSSACALRPYELPLYKIVVF